MAIALERPPAAAWPALRTVAHAAQWLFQDRRDVLATLAIVVAVWASNTIGVLALADALHVDLVWRYAWVNLLDVSRWAVAAYLTARWSAGWTLTGWRRHAAVMLVATGALLLIVGFNVFARPPEPESLPFGIDSSSPAISLSIAALWLPLTLLLSAQFHRSQQERAATGRLKLALREQQAAQRRFALAQLQALQSRIDPRFLFDMLQSIRHAYESDPPRAEALLEELIVFLRTVLPRVHADASTLGREADIAVQYARLMAAAQRGAGELQAAIPGMLTNLPFPPGVLLPLVSDLLQQGATAKAPIQLSVAMAADGCELTLHCARAPREAALAVARTALEQAWGDADAVRVSGAADGVRVTLRLVDELA